MGCLFCMRIVLILYSEVSVFIIKGWVKSGKVKTGGEDVVVFSISNAVVVLVD